MWCVWGHEVVLSWRGWFWCSFRVIWVVWGVFTDKHVDANCRTVNLMFFQVAVLRTGKEFLAIRRVKSLNETFVLFC